MESFQKADLVETSFILLFASSFSIDIKAKFFLHIQIVLIYTAFFFLILYVSLTVVLGGSPRLVNCFVLPWFRD